MKKVFSALCPVFVVICALCFLCLFADETVENDAAPSVFHGGAVAVTDTIFSGMAEISTIDMDARGNILVCVNPGIFDGVRQKYMMLLRPDGSLLRTYEFYSNHRASAGFTEDDSIVLCEARNDKAVVIDAQGEVLYTYLYESGAESNRLTSKYFLESDGVRYSVNFMHSRILAAKDPAMGQSVFFEVQSANSAFLVFWLFSMILLIGTSVRLFRRLRPRRPVSSPEPEDAAGYGCFTGENEESYGCFTGETLEKYGCFLE